MDMLYQQQGMLLHGLGDCLGTSQVPGAYSIQANNVTRRIETPMSSLYKRPTSPYYWWTANYRGRRLRKSTGLTQKHLARKVQEHWDISLILGNLEVLGLLGYPSPIVADYHKSYLGFLESRKSEKTVKTAEGILRKFSQYLESRGVKRLDEITVKILNGYIDWLECAPKTKKNHMGVISCMLDQAIKEDVLTVNPAKRVTLPRIVHEVRHRPLEQVDLEIIWRGAGGWSLYYAFLLFTGLRAGDVAMLTYGNIDRKKHALVSFVRKSRRIHEFPLSKMLLDRIPEGRRKDEPLFPALYADNERKLNDNLAEPRKYMQALLEAAGRPKATLHSFRAKFNNTLRDLGLPIEDRQVLLAHSASETTKIYTHPNFDLAAKYVNRIPDPANLAGVV